MSEHIPRIVFRVDAATMKHAEQKVRAMLEQLVGDFYPELTLEPTMTIYEIQNLIAARQQQDGATADNGVEPEGEW